MMKMKNSPGFSLLELVVALAITSMCVALVAMSFGAVSRGHLRAQEHLELQQTLNQAAERIRKLLQAAYFTPYMVNQIQSELGNQFETFDTARPSEPYDAITFTTLANTTYKIDAKEADIAGITLFTEKQAPLYTPERVVPLRKLKVRIGGEINDRFEVTGGKVYTLAGGVTRFELEYLDADAEWKTEWHPIDHNGLLPCAIRVTLGLRSENMGESAAVFIVPMQMSHIKCRFEEEEFFKR